MVGYNVGTRISPQLLNQFLDLTGTNPMRFEQITVQEWSDKTQFRPSILAKCAVLTDILGEITLDPFLESRFAVRGETAHQLLGRDPIRLPNSINLHYVGSNAWKEFVPNRTEAVARLTLIGKEFGLSIDIQDSQDRTVVTYSWPNVLRQPEHLDLEIIWTERTAIHPVRRQIVWTPAGSGAFNALCLDEMEEIAYTAKEALFTASARSLQDLSDYAERHGDQWANPDMKRTFVLVASTLPRPLRTYSPDRLRLMSQREIEGSILPYMKFGSTLRSTNLIYKAQTALSALMDFGNEENSYLQTLDLGHFEPEILFPLRSDLAAQLLKVPAFRFKGVGARRVLAPKTTASESVSAHELAEKSEAATSSEALES